MFTRKKLIIGGALAALGALALGGAALYYAMVPHDAPAQATLGSAVASLNSAPSTTTGTPVAGDQSAGLTGTWVLASDGESFVGYRVKEQLATVGTFTAVGRTQNIAATLEFDGSAITDAQVTADLSTLTSDSAMRDGQLKRQALETATYPTAAFVLTQPIELGGVPAEGETVSATATGDLTLHGVTRSVRIPLQGQLTNGHVVVVGSLDIAFADFGIQKPSSAIVLGVEDHGILELQLVLQQGTQA
jgi:polyisoprenoid-binding protein YceI